MPPSRLQQSSQMMPPVSNSFMENFLMSGATKYISVFMSIASQAPAFFFGFVLMLLILLFIIGRQQFRSDLEPIMGFHIFALFLLRELIAPWQRGRNVATIKRKEIDKTSHFDQDIKLQYNVKPD